MGQVDGIKAGCAEFGTEGKMVADVWEQIKQEDMELILFFCSSQLDQDKVAEHFREKSQLHTFNPAKIAGCTSSGEITPLGFKSRSLTAMSFSSKNIKAGIGIGEDITNDPIRAGKAAVTEAARQLGIFPDKLDRNYVGIVLIDGTCEVEEYIMLGIAKAARRLKVIGGSAGDDYSFQNVVLHANYKTYRNAVVFILLKTGAPFETVSVNNYLPTTKTLQVTKADPVKRVVYEFNGRLAVEEYGRITGVSPQDLAPGMFMVHPLGLDIGGSYFLRSPLRVENGGGLKFFCNIPEGSKLTVMKPGNLTGEIKKAIDRTRKDLGQISAIIAFNCILIYLGSEAEHNTGHIFNILNIAPLCGFNTYGEQYNGLHINQTMTMLILGGIIPQENQENGRIRNGE